MIANPTSIHEDAVRSLPLLSRLKEIQCCHELWCRSQTHGLDPALLWLWLRLEATALITPLAWRPPCAEDAAKKFFFNLKKKMYVRKKEDSGNWRLTGPKVGTL